MAAATVTYLTPNGSTPTAASAQNRQRVVATVSPANTGDTAQITHGWNLTSAQLAAGWPTVTWQNLTVNGIGAAWIYASSNANFVWLSKTNTTASGESTSTTPQLLVTIERPHSLVSAIQV